MEEGISETGEVTIEVDLAIEAILGIAAVMDTSRRGELTMAVVAVRMGHRMAVATVAGRTAVVVMVADMEAADTAS